VSQQAMAADDGGDSLARFRPGQTLAGAAHYTRTPHSAAEAAETLELLLKDGSQLSCYPHTTIFAFALKHSIDVRALGACLRALVTRHAVLLPPHHHRKCAPSATGAAGAVPAPAATGHAATPRCTCVDAALDFEEVCLPDTEFAVARVGARVAALGSAPWLAASTPSATLRVRLLTRSSSSVACGGATPGGGEGSGGDSVPAQSPHLPNGAPGADAAALVAGCHVMIIAAPRALVDPTSMGILLQEMSALCVGGRGFRVCCVPPALPCLSLLFARVCCRGRAGQVFVFCCCFCFVLTRIVGGWCGQVQNGPL